MKQNNILWLVLLLFISSCGEGDSTNPSPNPIPEPEQSIYFECLPVVAENTLDVVTWNIERFPIVSSAIESVAEVINALDADLIAVQEITNDDDFNALIDLIPGWAGFTKQFNGGNTMLGYLYKESEITLIGTPMFLYEEQSADYNEAFTAFRRPYHAKFQHINGLEIDFINVHLKCCDGSENRRRKASVLLKEYMDQNLLSDEVVLLGDFNDEIVDEDDNVFQNFIDDNENYLFSTMAIAQGDDDFWSFPNWPSQIDQILISDELFVNEIHTNVLEFDFCNDNFLNIISDHRPVLISFQRN